MAEITQTLIDRSLWKKVQGAGLGICLIDHGCCSLVMCVFQGVTPGRSLEHIRG